MKLNKFYFDGDLFNFVYIAIKCVIISSVSNSLSFRNVKNKIHQVISYNFGIPFNKLYLTHPTFFSEMTTKSAKTVHDEYWHVHIDKVS